MAEFVPYKELMVWQLAIAVATRCHTVTRAFPGSEPLREILPVNSVRVATTIAEANESGNKRSYLAGLNDAMAKLGRLETSIIQAHRTGLMSADPQLMADCEKIRRLLKALIRAVEGKR